MVKTDQEKKEATYENDKIALVVNYKPACIVEYTIDVKAPVCADSRKKAAKSLGKDVVIPGFRKGKLL